MLKKLNKENNKKISDSLSKFKKLPKSKKVYFKSDRFKEVNVGMREITLEDQNIKNLIVLLPAFLDVLHCSICFDY